MTPWKAVLLLLLPAWICLTTAGAAPAHEAVSPGKRFIAKWNGVLTIEDARTGERAFAVNAVKEFLRVEWLDGNRLLAEEAQAGGSFCSLVALTAGQWQRTTIEPDTLDTSSFYRYKRAGDLLKTEFIGYKRKGLEFDYSKIELTVDLTQGTITPTGKTHLAEDQYRSLLAAIHPRKPDKAK